jgi:tetratricopeptide (TPR) repeat protein
MWKKTEPSLNDAPSTWSKIIGLAETGQTSESWELFNELIARQLKDPSKLLTCKICIYSATGDSTSALRLILQANAIQKQRNRGQKDRYGHDLSLFDYRIDGCLGSFYSHWKMWDKALQVYQKTLESHLSTVESLSESLTGTDRQEFEAEQMTWTDGYYQEIALMYEVRKDHDQALAMCQRSLECANSYNPPPTGRFPKEQTERVRRCMREGAERLMERINREKQLLDTGASAPGPQAARSP